jgi:Flp pilus assembly protein TadG
MKQLINKFRSKRGNAILEFALAAGVLVPAFAGTFQYGYTFYVYNNLASAVRDGARYASMIPYNSSSSTPSAAYTTAVKNTVVYGNSAGTGSPVVLGLTTSKVEILPTMAGAIPKTITVRITGFAVNAIFGTTTFTGKPSTTFSYTGTPAPE